MSDQNLPQIDTHGMTELGYKILLDRYALRDVNKKQVNVGDIVIAIVSGNGASDMSQRREVAVVTGIAHDTGDVNSVNTVVYVETNSGETFELPLSLIDVPLEKTPQQVFKRVAHHIAQAEKQWPGQALWEQKFNDIMQDFLFVPGGRILAGAGSNADLTFFNCFVIAIQQDSRGAIIDTLGRMTEIMSRGGGVGINTSILRPRSAYVKGVNGRSSGAVSWGSLYSFVTGLIEQGGCFSPDARIATDKGLIPAAELADRMDAGETFHAQTHKGLRQVTARFRNGVKPLYELTTERGYRVKITEDHKVAVLMDGQITTMALKYLQPGDEMLLLLGEPTINGTSSNENIFFAPSHVQLEYAANLLSSEEALSESCVADLRIVLAANGILWTNRQVTYEAIRSRQMQPTSVGVGIDFADVAPQVAKDTIRSIEPVGESEVFDFEVDDVHLLSGNGIYTSNSRRGALLLMINDWHPDLIEFIHSKRQAGKITNANISIGFSDAFMAAVANDSDWSLRFPDTTDSRYDAEWDGDLELWESKGYPVIIYQTLKAKALWQQVMESAWASAEPGVLFRDVSAKSSNSYFYPEGKHISVNPCVTGDTWVSTKDGYVKARDIQVGTLILTPSGYKPVEKVYNNGVQRIYRVDFSDGGYLEGTADHKLKVNRNKESVWVAISDLSVGDRVLVISNGSDFDNLLHDAWGKRFDSKDYVSVEHHVGDTWLTSVVSIADTNRDEEVFDLYEPETLTWVTNGYASFDCAEQNLPANAVCNLGALNLSKFYDESAHDVNWDRLQHCAFVAARFLDDVIDMNIYHDEAIKTQQTNERRIGLGIMGLAELMILCGIRYGSPESVAFTEKVMRTIAEAAYLSSVESAIEKGQFGYLNREAGREAFVESGFMRGMGQNIREMVLKYGIRNVTIVTVAPTGSTSTMMNTSSGIEPFFAWEYYRKGRLGVHKQYSEVVSRYISGLAAKGIIVPEEDVLNVLPDYFVSAMELTPTEHVSVQAAAQKYVDSSISKCIVGNSLVLTTGGLKRISTLSQNRIVDSFSPLNVDIHSDNGIQRATEFYYGGVKPTKRVNLQYGYSIEGTPNHRIKILNREGLRVWKRLDELCVDDIVPVSIGTNIFGEPNAPLPSFTGNARGRRFTVPSYMTEDIAFILGAIVSEGSVMDNGTSITNSDSKLLAVLSDLIQDNFGLNSRITPDYQNENVFDLRIHSRQLIHWLRNDIGIGRGAANKTIPDVILSASYNEVRAFLRGLWLDAYMTQDGRMFGIGLASKPLIEQLQILFLNMGVFSRMHKVAANAWAVTVSGKALDVLAEKIDFQESWKTERLGVRNVDRQILRNMGTALPSIVSSEILNVINNSQNSLLSAFKGDDKGYYRMRNVVQRSRLNKPPRINREDFEILTRHYHDNMSDFLVNFQEQDSDDAIYLQVISIEDSSAEVYDISVPETHAFIANGIINHNTVNMPYDATVGDVGDVYMMLYEMGCKGGTIYRDGSRDDQVLKLATTESDDKTKDAAVADQDVSNNSLEYVAADQKATITVAGGVVLNESEIPIVKTAWLSHKPRPAVLHGSTYNKKTNYGTLHVTINSDESNNPLEVFISVGKSGSDLAAEGEAIGRLISIALRNANPESRLSALSDLAEQLSHIGGARPAGLGANRIASFPDAISTVLNQHVELVMAKNTPHYEVAYNDVSDDDKHVEGYLIRNDSGFDGHAVDGQISYGDASMTYTSVSPANVTFGHGKSKPKYKKSVAAAMCPSCDSYSLVNIEGCKKCELCGHAEC